MDAQQRELEHLRLELARAHGHIEELRIQLEVHSLEPTELREAVQNLEQQLVERDEELEELRRMVREGDAWRRKIEVDRRKTEESLARDIEAFRREVQLIKSTRLWRAGERYWETKARLRAFVRRGGS
jgi:septal ring factor EnvC (AmiA/AmiB activator)